MHAWLNAEAAGFGEEADGGLVHGFATEAEGAEVHGDHRFGAEVEEGLEGFFGAGVNGAVGVREVSADGKEGDLRGEAEANFAKAREVSGVSGVVDAVAGGGDDVSPEASVDVAEEACAPVFTGGCGDVEVEEAG